MTLSGGREVKGTLATEGGQLRVGGAAAPLTEVTTIRDEAEQQKYERLLAPGWLDLWSGYFDVGLALARGNARTTTVSTAFEAVRLTRADKTRVYFNQIYSTATADRQSNTTAQAARGGWSYDHNIGGRWYLNTFNDYEYDRFQNLDLRFVVGGGLDITRLRASG